MSWLTHLGAVERATVHGKMMEHWVDALGTPEFLNKGGVCAMVEGAYGTMSSE